MPQQNHNLHAPHILPRTMKNMKIMKRKDNEFKENEDDLSEEVEIHFLYLRGLLSLLLNESHQSLNTISITTKINFYFIYSR
jgi:hypothetical protein